MPSRPAVVLLFALLLGLGARTAAGGDRRPLVPPQPIPEGEAAAPLLAGWLEGGTQREAAWAGWEAGERDLRGLSALVAARLAREVARASPDRSNPLELVLIDAALRLRVPLPIPTLEARGWWRAEVATYLCLWPVGPEHMRAFEALDADPRDGSRAWYAVGGRLFEARLPVFVRRVLDRWTLRRMLRVWDRDGPYPPFRGPGDSMPGDMVGRLPDDFPPIPVRRLGLRHYDGATRLVGGPFPVYGRRAVIEGTHLWWSDVLGSRPTPDEARHGWLAAWLERAGVPPLPPWAAVSVKWTGGRQPWARATGAAIGSIHDDWRAWRDALLARGLLTRGMVEGLEPHITWELRDERVLRTRPLPAVPTLPFDVRAPSGRRVPRCRRGI